MQLVTLAEQQAQASVTASEGGDTTTLNREAWLERAIALLRPDFEDNQTPLPVLIKVSVGWPGGKRSAKAIGQYWPPALSTNDIPQIFISPVIEDPVRALDILVHELVHAATPGDGHGKAFKRCALAMGLEGKMTATVAGPGLTARLTLLRTALGEYPHGALREGARATPKQGTRLLKACCDSCGYTVRVTMKWLDLGAPLCPVHMSPMSVTLPETEGEDA